MPSDSNPVVENGCHVFLFDLYISKLPVDAVSKDIFYCHPLPSLLIDEGKPWYTDVPVGQNLLGNMVAKMCEETKVDGVKTNHSLRVAGTTTLSDAGVPENIIQ